MTEREDTGKRSTTRAPKSDSAGSSEWTSRAQSALRKSEQELSETVRRQLSNARQRAIAMQENDVVGDSRLPAWGESWKLFTGGSVLAGVALVLVLALPRSGGGGMPLLDEFEMAAAQEVELLEDLEFVAWMLAEEGDDGQGIQAHDWLEQG